MGRVQVAVEACFNSSNHQILYKHFNTFLNPSMRKSYLIKIMLCDKFHRTLILSGFCFLKIAKFP